MRSIYIKSIFIGMLMNYATLFLMITFVAIQVIYNQDMRQYSYTMSYVNLLGNLLIIYASFKMKAIDIRFHEAFYFQLAATLLEASKHIILFFSKNIIQTGSALANFFTYTGYLLLSIAAFLLFSGLSIIAKQNRWDDLSRRLKKSIIIYILWPFYSIVLFFMIYLGIADSFSIFDSSQLAAAILSVIIGFPALVIMLMSWMYVLHSVYRLYRQINELKSFNLEL